MVRRTYRLGAREDRIAELEARAKVGLLRGHELKELQKLKSTGKRKAYSPGNPYAGWTQYRKASLAVSGPFDRVAGRRVKLLIDLLEDYRLGPGAGVMASDWPLVQEFTYMFKDRKPISPATTRALLKYLPVFQNLSREISYDPDYQEEFKMFKSIYRMLSLLKQNAQRMGLSSRYARQRGITFSNIRIRAATTGPKFAR